MFWIFFVVFVVYYCIYFENYKLNYVTIDRLSIPYEFEIQVLVFSIDSMSLIRLPFYRNEEKH
jgi:hypothetical protein